MKYIIILLALLNIIGCTELEQVNPNALTEDSYWVSADDAQKGVTAIYSTFRRVGISRMMPILYNLRSDAGVCYSADGGLVNHFDKFITTNYNNGNYLNIWGDCYRGINRANQVLDNIPDIEMDEDLKNQYIGEAKFLRGLFYYHLALLWGNVPLQLHTSTATDYPSTSTEDEVWAQVESDLTEAVSLLPSSYSAEDIGRATEGAARAQLAKVYMQQHKFQEAKDVLDWMVTGEGKNYYDLMTNYQDNFLVATENNEESIFEWQYVKTENEAASADDIGANINPGTSLAKFTAPAGPGYLWCSPYMWVIDEFNETTSGGARDPRIEKSFLYAYTDERGPAYTDVYGETFQSRYGTGVNSTRAWYRKFLNDATQTTEDVRSGNNYRYIRYADVLLMYAECLNEIGSTDDAYQYVNRVRNRSQLANLVNTSMTEEEFLEQIKHERLTELTGEGHRWADLKRWGMLSNPSELETRDAAFENFVVGRDELLPIPQVEIDINPNLEQNPGW